MMSCALFVIMKGKKRGGVAVSPIKTVRYRTVLVLIKFDFGSAVNRASPPV
jgi:hypothetical protein